MQKFNLFELIDAISMSIDIAESTISKEKEFHRENFYSSPSLANHKFFNHSKRTCFVALKIAEKISYNDRFLEDVYISSMLHDIGVCCNLVESHTTPDFIKTHTEKGYMLVSKLPFNSEVSEAVKYHHENYNGTGPYGISGASLPIKAQIIRLADVFEILYNSDEANYLQRDKITKWVISNENIIFSSKIVKAFLDVQSNDCFWWDYEMLGFTSANFDVHLKVKSLPITIDELRDIAYVFADIIDNKSSFTYQHSYNLADLVIKLCDFLNYDYEKKTRLEIAALLHDIGKLAVPETILTKNATLNDLEFSIVKSHAYYTRVILSKINGLEDIVDISSNHHEKLDGTGYPLGLTAKDISFDSRMMAICDIYDALTSTRPYKKNFTKEDTFAIIDKMASDGKICKKALSIFKECFDD
ncbi:HD-GYP domain-containing protein [Clostridium sp.]|uniref:HD-GYP domain-containing protein n=1 Tax=Clostridium sp. TaxID=1506 RepID=UPI002FC6989F